MARWITRKRITIALCLMLSGVLGTAGTVAYLTFLRSPADPPARVCGDRRAPGGPLVVAAGASLTRGTLGADWVGRLRERPEFRGYTFVNSGVNGDTTAGLLARTDTDIVRCRPDAVTLLIGTNDVRDGVSPQRYRDNLAAIVERIRSRTSARIALMSLPPLGEDLDADINRRLGAYNTAIRDIAARAGVDYVPVHETMAERLRGRGGGGVAFGFGFGLAYRAGAEHYLLGRSWDEIARGNGLELFVDHIHLSDRGGAVVTDLAAQWLSATARPAGGVVIPGRAVGASRHRAGVRVERVQAAVGVVPRAVRYGQRPAVPAHPDRSRGYARQVGTHRIVSAGVVLAGAAFVVSPLLPWAGVPHSPPA